MHRLESFLKIITPLGAVIAFFIGIYHYRDTKEDEFKRSYWEKRYDVYEHLSQMSSHIANAGSQLELDSFKHQFHVLHSGRLILVQDLHVFNAVESFGKTLNSAVFPDSLNSLHLKARNIGQACRASLKETWEPVPVSELKEMEE